MADYKPYVGKEDDFQQSVATYLRTKYRKVLFCHIPNGGSRHGKEAAKLKGMGVRAGMPDLMVFHHARPERRRYCGMVLELKVGKNKPTTAQQECLEALDKAGWRCHVTHSLDEAMALIDEYLG